MDCDPKLPRLQSSYFNKNFFFGVLFENKNDKKNSFTYFGF